MRYINEIALCVVAICVVVMVGCSPAEELPRDSEGRREMSPNELCLNGVVYYGQYLEYQHGFLAPKFKPDSTVETCE